MGFYHHTNRQLDPESLPIDLRTEWEESHYWRSRSRSMDVQLPALENLEQLVKSMAHIPAGERGTAIRAISAALEPRIVDVFIAVATESISPALGLERIRQLKVQAEIDKEILFEEVRVAEYPDLPTRKRCIFLFDPQDPMAYALRMKFSLLERVVVEVDPLAGARVHRGDAALLNCTARAPGDQRDYARRYWRGEMTSEAVPAGLLEGPFRITLIVRPA